MSSILASGGFHRRCRLNIVLAIDGANGFVSTEVQNSTFVLRINSSAKNPAHRQYAARCGETPLRYVSPHRVDGLHPLDVLRKASHIKRICEIEKNFRFANFFPTSQIRRHDRSPYRMSRAKIKRTTKKM